MLHLWQCEESRHESVEFDLSLKINYPFMIFETMKWSGRGVFVIFLLTLVIQPKANSGNSSRHD